MNEIVFARSRFGYNWTRSFNDEPKATAFLLALPKGRIVIDTVISRKLNKQQKLS